MLWLRVLGRASTAAIGALIWVYHRGLARGSSETLRQGSRRPDAVADAGQLAGRLAGKLEGVSGKRTLVTVSPDGRIDVIPLLG